jgi:ABC-type phosphate/phosphonate transport system substrate-binding protein
VLRYRCFFNYCRVLYQGSKLFYLSFRLNADEWYQIYTSGDNWYYAVAVAKEQDPDTDLTYLRGKRTCHAGLGLAAGWVYPLAYLISNGWIRYGLGLFCG